MTELLGEMAEWSKAAASLEAVMRLDASEVRILRLSAILRKSPPIFVRPTIGALKTLR